MKQVFFYPGKGKNLLKIKRIAGIEIMAKIKLATMNWLVIALLPPDLCVKMGIAVIGGTAACKIMVKAIGKSG